VTNRPQASAQVRDELDRSIPLAERFPVARPVFGPTPFEYYRQKHNLGAAGNFFPLHTTYLYKKEVLE
jgi:hypothetical protein